MERQKQINLVKKVKDHLNSFCESLTKTVQPLKMAIIAELHIDDNIDGYFLEDDVIELCVIVIDDTINSTQNFIENLRVESLHLQLKEKLNNIERSIARAMTTLQMFARTKDIDYKSNKSLCDIETLSLTVKQIVDSIDYESMSDAISALDEIFVADNLKFEKSALVESNN